MILHDVVFNFNEELFHWENVIGDIEASHRDKKGSVVEADQLSQDLSPQIGLEKSYPEH